MKRTTWIVLLCSSLLLASAALHGLNFAIFRDGDHLVRQFFSQLGFVPISILLITLFVNELMKQREAQARRRKLNMVIGAFFSRMGSELLRKVSRLDESGELGRLFADMRAWGQVEFDEARSRVAGVELPVLVPVPALAELNGFLAGHRDFLYALLGNPVLLEHEDFTNVCWAVLHLADELDARDGFDGLPASDLRHLGTDVARATRVILVQWVAWMAHLRTSYPYFFSLAVRDNPFVARRDVVVTED